MKKYLIWIACATIGIVSSCLTASAAVFDIVGFNGWTDGWGSGTPDYATDVLVNATPLSGTGVLKYEHVDGDPGRGVQHLFDSPLTGTVDVKYNLYIPTGANGGWFNAYLMTDASSNDVSSWGATYAQNGGCWIEEWGGITGPGLTRDVWQEIKLHFDFGAGTAQYFLDGVAVGSPTAIAGVSLSGINYQFQESYMGGDSAFIDGHPIYFDNFSVDNNGTTIWSDDFEGYFGDPNLISIDAIAIGSVPVSGSVTGGLAGQTGAWNPLDLTGSQITLTNLTNGAGSASAIGFVFDADNVGYHVQQADAPYNPGVVLAADNPERSWVTGGESPVTFKFTGLTVGGNYELAIYSTGYGDAPESALKSYTINGTVYTNPVNILITTQTADTNGDIVGVVSCDGDAYTWYAELAGFQLKASAAPPALGVTVASPTNNQAFSIYTSFSATATVANGTAPITVSFYTNSAAGAFAQAGAATTNVPYQVNLGTLAAGTYHIYAAVTDSVSSAISATNTFTVSDLPPTVTITNPANAASFAEGAPIAITATATDDGSVTNVAFYADGLLLGSAASAPYTNTWSGATAGAHALTAIATDNTGLSTTSATVNVTVVQPTDVISVDFVVSGSPGSGPCSGDTTLTGTDMKNAVGNIFTGQAGTWNALNIGTYNNNSAITGFLTNGLGAVTTVKLALGLQATNDATAAGGWRCSPNEAATNSIKQLRNESAYLYSPMLTVDHYAWAFTGLTPNGHYKLTLFGSGGNSFSNTANGVAASKDSEGDWNWTDIQADASGVILGTLATTGNNETCGLYGAQIQAIANPPPPEAPTNLTATAGNATVGLGWDAVTNATAGYLVKRSLTNGSYEFLGSTADANATNYTDNAVSNGVLYWYVVSATNQWGESSNSAPVSARPLPAVAPTPELLTGSGVNSGYSLDPASGEVRLQFTGMGGIKYTIVYKDDLLDSTWHPLPATEVTCTNNGTGPMTLVYTNAPDVTQRFYRVEAQLPSP